VCPHLAISVFSWTWESGPPLSFSGEKDGGGRRHTPCHRSFFFVAILRWAKGEKKEKRKKKRGLRVGVGQRIKPLPTAASTCRRPFFLVGISLFFFWVFLGGSGWSFFPFFLPETGFVPTSFYSSFQHFPWDGKTWKSGDKSREEEEEEGEEKTRRSLSLSLFLSLSLSVSLSFFQSCDRPSLWVALNPQKEVWWGGEERAAAPLPPPHPPPDTSLPTTFLRKMRTRE
jgi:hypothetical protein